MKAAHTSEINLREDMWAPNSKTIGMGLSEPVGACITLHVLEPQDLVFVLLSFSLLWSDPSFLVSHSFLLG
jgi:hypothetical protein